MNKIFLAGLLVLMIISPCLAQERANLFSSIEGTQWIGSEFRISIEPPYISRETSILGFYHDTVYSCSGVGVCVPLEDYSYSDFLLFSIAYTISYSIRPFDYHVELFVMQPYGGFGILRNIRWWRDPDCVPAEETSCTGGYFATGTMVKIIDDWIPPENE